VVATHISIIKDANRVGEIETSVSWETNEPLIILENQSGGGKGKG